jgi:hypothetical protein
MGGQFSRFSLNLNKFEKIAELKLVKCSKIKSTFTVQTKVIELKKELIKINELKMKEKDLTKKMELNNQYIDTLNLLLESIIKDKKYINELISYLEEVKIKCLSNYKKYLEMVLEIYSMTNPIHLKRKLNKKIRNDLANINFGKLSVIILDKLNISKKEREEALNKYLKNVQKIGYDIGQKLAKSFIKKVDKKVVKKVDKKVVKKIVKKVDKKVVKKVVKKVDKKVVKN